MICESGRVVSVEDNWAMVETIQVSACKSCSAKAGCGQSVLGSVFSGKRHLIRVSLGNLQGQVAINDQVELAIDDDIMLRSSLLVYLLPLVAMILGALFGRPLFSFLDGDGPALLGAACGFIFSCLALAAFNRRNNDNPRYQPVLNRVLSSDEQSLSIVEASAS